jgi:hypothetical protein
MSLETDFNLGRDADDLYAELVAAHEGLSEPESAALDARLILILLNHIGDPAVIRAAIAAAAQR